jgi:putative transposase
LARPTDATPDASIFERDGAGIYGREGSASFVLDQNNLLACARYVELNPVRAGIVKRPQAWRWSSADAHVRRKDDLLARTEPLLAMIESPWRKFLSVKDRDSEMVLFRKHERTGRPIGDDAFIERLERLLDRELKPKKPGPKAIDK